MRLPEVNGNGNGHTTDLRRTRPVRGEPTPRSMDRLPPHSIEDEMGVLGCILLDPQACLPEAIAKFGKDGDEVFYDLRHRNIYTSMREMWDAATGIDVITLQGWMKDRDRLDQIGGIGYLASLPDMVPSAANLDFYLEAVHEKFLLRRLIQVATGLVGSAYDYQGQARELIDRAEREVLSIRLNHDHQNEPKMRDLVMQAMAEIEEAHNRKGIITGIPTGLIDLDKLTGGLHEGHMVVVAGFTSGGKTSLAMNISEHVLLNSQLPVGVFSLEMTALELVKRCICSHARVNLKNVRDGFLADRDFPRLTNAAGKLSGCAIHFDETSGISVHEFRARARRMWQRHGIKLFVVDYLQLLNAEGGSRRVENRQQEVSDIALGVKNLAKELRVPVIALSQLNDDGKLRESRAIGQHADDVWVLERAADQSTAEEAESVAVNLRVRKQRTGPIGLINLVFLKTITRFEMACKVGGQDMMTDEQQQML